MCQLQSVGEPYTKAMLLCNIGRMRPIPTVIRSKAPDLPHKTQRRCGRPAGKPPGWLTRPFLILAAMMPAMISPAAGAAEEDCRTCALVSALAGELGGKASELARLADMASEQALAGQTPQAMRWPGPARLDSDSTVWTHQHLALAQSRAAERAAHVAEGVGRLAAAAARAAQTCSREPICTVTHQGSPPHAGHACAVLNTDMSGDLAQSLAPVQAVTRALEQEALTCAAMACPGAECSARHVLLEKAAFAQGILSAAAGEVSIAMDPGGRSPAGSSSAAPGDAGIAALSGLPAILTVSGLDPAGTQQLAAGLAAFENKLIRPDGPDAGLPHWRRVSARLALAGMRGALGTLRLEGRLVRPAVWEQAATRLETALKALMRLEQSPGGPAAGQSSAVACPGVDPDLTRALFRLRNAVNSAAICSVRSGCTAQEAIDAGAARAAQLVSAPVFELRLELVKALEEEVAITPGVFNAAKATAEPAPQISPDRQTYQQGAAIALDVDISNNRCLAAGGHVALIPADEAAGAPPVFLDDVAPDVDTVQLTAPSQRPDTRLLFRAPREGSYSAVVYAAPAEGGALLGAAPIRISRGEPEYCDRWTGVWDTEFGRLVTVEDEAGNVSGTYARSPDVQPGFVFGRVRNNQMQGVWVSEISTGGTRLTLEEEGVFRGSWGLTPQQVTNGGRWSGTCIIQ